PLQPLVAHRAGNDLAALAKAFATGVDFAEADVWLRRGRLEVRHDKTAGPLPFLWERWTLKPGWTPRLLLHDVLAAASGHGRLFIDLKGSEARIPDAVAGAVRQAGAGDSVAFSTPTWPFLDRLAELLPDAPLFYTLGKIERLAELRPRLARREIRCVSVDSRILTQEIMLELRAGGVGPVVSWAVETPEDARRVLGWGAGVTSKDLALLAAIRNGELSAGLDQTV
ncbi:MAG: glycerophosphodiester phosphodiesterase, partial [Dehalococcoidia bacterium]